MIYAISKEDLLKSKVNIVNLIKRSMKKKACIVFILLIVLLQGCTDQAFMATFCHDTSKDSFMVKLWCKMQGDDKPTSPKSGCIDFDAGIDYTKWSYTISGEEKGRSEDYCISEFDIFEYYCTEKDGSTYLSATSYSCPHGCEAGACKNG